MAGDRQVGEVTSATLSTRLESVVASAFAKTPVPTTLEDREAVHDVRILAKRLRYAYGWLSPAFQHGPGPRRMLKRAQRAVGDSRDLDLFVARLTHHAAALEHPFELFDGPLLLNTGWAQITDLEASRTIVDSGAGDAAGRQDLVQRVLVDQPVTPHQVKPLAEDNQVGMVTKLGRLFRRLVDQAVISFDGFQSQTPGLLEVKELLRQANRRLAAGCCRDCHKDRNRQGAT